MQWHFFQHMKTYYFLLVLNILMLAKQVKKKKTKVSFLKRASPACSEPEKTMAALSPLRQPSRKFKGEILESSQSLT